jgi:hypothetical protein
MFDLIQDFGPMFASMGRGISKAGSTTWGFFTRSIMLFINFALVVGIIYLSVGHSYTLLIYSGFSGVAAWVAVAVWEAVFIYCSMLIDNAHRNQRKVGWAAWIGFLMGFAFVGVSNYMGMASNTIGKIIGISTPFLLLVMKKVLEHQFKNEPAEKQNNTSWFSSIFKLKKKKVELLSENPIQELPRITEISEVEKPVLETKIDDENLIDIETKKDKSEPLKNLDLVDQKENQNPLDIEHEKLNDNPDLDAPKTETVSLDIEEENPAPELIENLDEHPVEKQPKSNKQEKTSSGRKPRKSKGSTGKKKPKKVTADLIDYDAIIEVAKRMIDEHPEKKKPTKYKLAKMAKTTEPNVTEHHAQKALDMMDQQEVNLIENLNQNLNLEADQKLDLERPKLKLAK